MSITATDTSQTFPALVSANSHFQLSLVSLLRCVFDASSVDMQIKPEGDFYHPRASPFDTTPGSASVGLVAPPITGPAVAKC
ncbi:hypothetical protein N7517_000349 [Penicillium concentricum]|uniref:Uncharacterized protein n=1 Tax=Penicillium concentricum TaxID=293559 RepID=A0A9W9STX3_9EURO|nr:uncharacterized protein N7517_000349 [Penicillium concentricum]KAJ5382438.1 hypothetical protein N7517_000349 [Penicillium concentricum]